MKNLQISVVKILRIATLAQDDNIIQNSEISLIFLKIMLDFYGLDVIIHLLPKTAGADEA